jgi:hypothetical protein
VIKKRNMGAKLLAGSVLIAICDACMDPLRSGKHGLTQCMTMDTGSSIVGARN